MKNFFLTLSRLKIHIILVLDIGLDAVRSTGNLSSIYNSAANVALVNKI